MMRQIERSPICGIEFAWTRRLTARAFAASLASAIAVFGLPSLPATQARHARPHVDQGGLSASNISAKPLTGTFEHSAIVNDLAIMPAAFGDVAP